MTINTFKDNVRNLVKLVFSKQRHYRRVGEVYVTDQFCARDLVGFAKLHRPYKRLTGQFHKRISNTKKHVKMAGVVSSNQFSFSIASSA